MENQNSQSSGPKKNTGMAVIAYIIFFIPLLTKDKNDPFVKFHVKQGLVLFITAVISSVISIIPILGWILSPIIGIFVLVLFIIGIMNAVNGKEKRLPLVGQFADNFNF